MRENKTNPWHARVLVISVTEEERGKRGLSVPHCWWGYRMAADANLGAEFSRTSTVPS